MTYHETIEYLYAQLPMFTRIGAAAYKEDLHNTIALCKALGNPQNNFKTIHIAGTNGKGSTSHMLAAILQQSGYKTGLYTSPHIKDFGERIRIDGKMIEESFVINFVENTKALTSEIQPSFFELTVGMAFQYFSEQKVDIAIIETGLGGRLDSTNIIQPEVAVITNIGYDHMNLLGNTLQEIAMQKAGIIKKNTPVVIGELLPETTPVFVKEANEKEAPVHFAQSRFITEYLDPAGNLLFCNVKDLDNNTFEKLRLDLTGIYQAKNVCTVLMTVEVLRKLNYHIPEQKMQEALENVKGLTGLRGRWDILQNHPAIICDVAHNKEGITQVVQQLKHQYPTSSLHFVLGFVKDKDVTEVLDLFPETAGYYYTNAHIPRALPYKELQEMAAGKGLRGNGYDDVNDAITAAKNNAGENDVIMICGSFFIVAEISEQQKR